MNRKHQFDIMRDEVAALSAALRDLHQAAHIVYWKYGINEVKKSANPDWKQLGDLLNNAAALMAKTRKYTP